MLSSSVCSSVCSSAEAGYISSTERSCSVHLPPMNAIFRVCLLYQTLDSTAYLAYDLCLPHSPPIILPSQPASCCLSVSSLS